MALSGIVKNIVTQSPLGEVRIELSDSGERVAALVSDRNGCFEYGLGKVAAGQSLTWIASRKDYECKQGELQVGEGDIALNIELNPIQHDMDIGRTTPTPAAVSMHELPDLRSNKPWAIAGLFVGFFLIVVTVLSIFFYRFIPFVVTLLAICFGITIKLISHSMGEPITLKELIRKMWLEGGILVLIASIALIFTATPFGKGLFYLYVVASIVLMPIWLTRTWQHFKGV